MSEQTNIYYMLERFYKEANLQHVFNLVKTIQLNFNAMIALLLDTNLKLNQKL